jgi:hypothetical protein
MASASAGVTLGRNWPSGRDQVQLEFLAWHKTGKAVADPERARWGSVSAKQRIARGPKETPKFQCFLADVTVNPAAFVKAARERISFAGVELISGKSVMNRPSPSPNIEFEEWKRDCREQLRDR